MAESRILPIQERASFLSRHQLDIQSYRMIPFWIGVAVSPIAFPWTRARQWGFVIVALVLMYTCEHQLLKGIGNRIGWAKPDYRAIQRAEPKVEKRARRYRMAFVYCAAWGLSMAIVMAWPGPTTCAEHAPSMLRSLGGLWPFQALIQCLRVACDKSNPRFRRVSYWIAIAALTLLYPVAVRSHDDQTFLAISTGVVMIAASCSDLLLLLELAPPREESRAA